MVQSALSETRASTIATVSRLGCENPSGASSPSRPRNSESSSRRLDRAERIPCLLLNLNWVHGGRVAVTEKLIRIVVESGEQFKSW